MKRILRDTCILSALMILSVFTVSIIWMGVTDEIKLVLQLFGRDPDTVAEAARHAHRRLKQVEFRQQAPDHPILWTGDDNSYYLKFYIFQVLDP